MGKTKFVIFLISLIAFFISLNGYAMAQLTEEQLEAFRSAKTVKIVVNQSYGRAQGVSLPFEDLTRRLLKYVGLEVVGTEVEHYDLKLKIEAVGMAISHDYFRVGKLYTGAIIEGSVSFEVQGIPVYEGSFKEIKKSQKTVMSVMAKYLKDPSDAPFKKLTYEFDKNIINMMAEVYGTKFLLKALEDKNHGIAAASKDALRNIKDPNTVEPLIAILINDESRILRSDVATVLGHIGDPRAIEPLIDSLKEEIKLIRDSILWALKNITGEDLGEDQEKWQKWWEENKEKFLKKK